MIILCGISVIPRAKFNEQFLQTESIIFTLYREYWNCLRNLVSLRNAWIFSRVCRRILDNNIIYNITHVIRLNFLVGRVGQITRNVQFHKRELGKLVDQLRVASGKLCRCTATAANPTPLVENICPNLYRLKEIHFENIPPVGKMKF